MAYTDLGTIDTYIRTNYPSYNYVYGDLLQLNTTYQENTAASATQNATITQVSTQSSGTTFQLSQTQFMVLYDFYTTASQTVDAVVTFIKNQKKQLATTDPLSSELVTNNTRPIIETQIFSPNDKLTATFLNLAATSTNSTSTDTAFAKVKFYDASFSQQVV